MLGKMFKPANILAFLTAISAIAVLVAIMIQGNNLKISQQLLAVFQPILKVCLVIFLIYMVLSTLVRRYGKSFLAEM